MKVRGYEFVITLSLGWEQVVWPFLFWAIEFVHRVVETLNILF